MNFGFPTLLTIILVVLILLFGLQMLVGLENVLPDHPDKLQSLNGD